MCAMELRLRLRRFRLELDSNSVPARRVIISTRSARSVGQRLTN